MGKSARTYQRIMDEGIRQVSASGLGAVSVGSLAGALEMSRSGVYAHFGSRDALELALVEASVAAFRARVLTHAFAQEPGAPRLRALFSRWLAWSDVAGLPGGCPVLAMAPELDDATGPAHDLFVATQRELHELLLGWAREAQDLGHTEASPELLAFSLHGAIQAAHLAHRVRHDPRALTLAGALFEHLLSLPQEIE